MWALVVYALAFSHPDGTPRASTWQPQYTEAQCLGLLEADRRDLIKAGYAAACQDFPEGSTPEWPGGGRKSASHQSGVVTLPKVLRPTLRHRAVVMRQAKHVPDRPRRSPRHPG